MKGLGNQRKRIKNLSAFLEGVGDHPQDGIEHEKTEKNNKNMKDTGISQFH
jgi:hypothetical protein